MEMKTKYQYTYFIYPYIVKEKNFDKYLQKLLKNKNCKLKIFDKNKDLEIYTYFLPKIRDYMFGSFDFNKNQIQKLEQFDNNMKASLLSKRPCVIFEYDIKKDIQGKAGNKDGIFFDIRKIEIICFNTGICFLNIKTTLDGSNNTLSDVCNFNNKFRDINSNAYKLKDYENINIQTDVFNDVKEISALIKSIIGNNIGAKELNLDTERFITYSYACIGQEEWNDSLSEELIQKEFYKYAHVKVSDSVIDYSKNINEKILTIEESKYIKYGCTNIGTVLLTSDINTENYTKIPRKYENEYLYNYIFNLYKKIYLKKINREYKILNKFEEAKKEFIEFTQNIWIEEVTNEDIGNILSEEWNTVLKTKRIYSEVKQKYDVMYKNFNIEKTAKSNKIIATILIILLIVNIINCIAIIR